MLYFDACIWCTSPSRSSQSSISGTIGVSYNWSGVEEEWTGLSYDKNSLGQVAMCSGIFWLWQILQRLAAGKS